MGKSDPPDPPDYTGAAKAEGSANIDLLQAQTFANRVNQTTPFGSSTWSPYSTTDPTTGKTLTAWNQSTRLTPDSQAALDAQLRLSALRSKTGRDMYSRVANDLAEPIDWNKFQKAGVAPEVRDPGDPEMFNQKVEDAIYGKMSSRLDPQWQQRQTASEVRMRNQGLQPGDQAYNDYQGNVDRAQTDAYQNAMNTAIAGAGAEATRAYGDKLRYSDQMYNQSMDTSKYQTALRQQQIAEEMQRRGTSLNEINALISGQQVGMPSMPSFNAAGRAAAPDITGAMAQGYQGQIGAYNAQQQQQQSTFGGLMSLAALALI